MSEQEKIQEVINRLEAQVIIEAKAYETMMAILSDTINLLEDNK